MRENCPKQTLFNRDSIGCTGAQENKKFVVSSMLPSQIAEGQKLSDVDASTKGRQRVATALARALGPHVEAWRSEQQSR